VVSAVGSLRPCSRFSTPGLNPRFVTAVYLPAAIPTGTPEMWRVLFLSTVCER
jgi:hypothetical protein